MVRASTAADAANAFTAVTQLNGITLQTRLTAAASTGGNNSDTVGILIDYEAGVDKSGHGHYLLPESSAATAPIRSASMTLGQ